MKRFNNQKGQGLTEYLILLVLIAIISIGATKELGKSVKGRLDKAKKKINAEIVIR